MKKVLIIEDESVVRNNIETLLSESGYKVFKAGNGIEGIKKAQTEMPDLIICDIMMPDIDGFEVLEYLNHYSLTNIIPFVFLTAKSDAADLRRGMNLGADDYIIKPFKAVELLQAVETRLKKYERIKTEKSKKALLNNTLNDDRNPYSFLPFFNSENAVQYADIVYITAEDVYSKLFYKDGRKVLFRKLLKDWEYELKGKGFLRIHRSTIVNINYVEKVERGPNGTNVIILRELGNKLLISRGYSKVLKEKYSNKGI